MIMSGVCQMPTSEPEKQNRVDKKEARLQRKAAIAKFVILALGQPRDLRHVQVKYLWQDHYRVNVLVGVDAGSAKVGHSYFLVADQQGNIMTSTPEIVRHY